MRLALYPGFLLLTILLILGCQSPPPTAIPAIVATATAPPPPEPTGTPSVIRVPFPTFTPSPAPTHTPAPPFEPGNEERVIAISQLPDDRFWRSGDPLWLVGCHISLPVELHSSLRSFSNSGEYSKANPVAMVEGGWSSEMVDTLRDDRTMNCLAMRVRYTGSGIYCLSYSPIFSDCPQQSEVTIPEFKAAGSLKDWAQLVPARVVDDFANAPTPMPTPTFTPAPTLVPTATLAPTPTPDLILAAHPLFQEFPPERILPVGKLNDTAEIWQDGEPLLLLGCYADIVGAHFISDTGGVNVNTLIAVVRGHFTDEEAAHGNCFALRVQYLALEEYCFYTDYGAFQINPFLFGSSCPGHLQSTPEFGLSRKAGDEAILPIMRTDIYPYE